MYMPPENAENPTASFLCACKIAQELLHLTMVDGVRFGTQLKHYWYV